MADGKREDVEPESDLKVTDRRLFGRDGELREELANHDAEVESEASEPEEPAEVTSPPEPQPGDFEHRPVEEPQGVDFTMLLNAMAQPALIFLGEIAHPGTGQSEINLEQARLQIDLLDVLRIKCRGNLTREEDELLDRMLYQLRMLYVSRSSQPQA